MNIFTVIVVGFLTLIGISVFFIGVGFISEKSGKLKSRTKGSGPSGRRYVFVNDSSLSDRKVNDIARSLMDKGHLVVKSDEHFELDVEEYESGSLVRVSIVDVEEEGEGDE